MNPDQLNNSFQSESFGILRKRYSDKATKTSQIKIGKIMALQKQGSFQDDQKVVQNIWHKRMMESKSYDAQVIVKMERISTPLLILIFLTAFVIIFLLTPMQTYHPPHE